MGNNTPTIKIGYKNRLYATLLNIKRRFKPCGGQKSQQNNTKTHSITGTSWLSAMRLWLTFTSSLSIYHLFA